MQESFPTWSFEIGDPTFLGWFTVVAYFYTFILSVLVFRKAENLFDKNLIGRQKIFWLIIAFVFLFLGFNKQLDLQSYITAIARYYARRDGWYDYRQIYQYSFVKFIIISSSLLLIFLIVFFRKMLITNILAIFGLCFLLVFISVRASSFHHMDILIGLEVLNFRVNWILELTGIILVDISAILILRRLKAETSKKKTIFKTV